jgi:hypothetical protein
MQMEKGRIDAALLSTPNSYFIKPGEFTCKVELVETIFYLNELQPDWIHAGLDRQRVSSSI